LAKRYTILLYLYNDAVDVCGKAWCVACVYGGGGAAGMCVVCCRDFVPGTQIDRINVAIRPE